MNAWVKVPIIKEFWIEKVTAHSLIKSEEVSHLSLQKDQIAQVIAKNKNWLWVIDESSNTGWVPKSQSEISTVIIPHLGVDTELRVAISIKNQTQKYLFEHEYESFCSKNTGVFTGIDWSDSFSVTIEASHRQIGYFRISVCEFKDIPQKIIRVDLKNFNCSGASIMLVVQFDEDKDLTVEEQLSTSEKSIHLKSGEILRYTCSASASCLNVYQVGKLSITNYRFLFTSGSNYDYILSVPHYTIDTFLVGLAQITVTTKDLRTISYFINQEYMRYVLDKYSELNGMHFCFDYHLAFASSSDFGWNIYDPDREFTRMGAFDSNLFYHSEVNLDYSLCESYPALLIQPVGVTEEELKIISGFRSRKRVPTVTWVGKSVAIYRSSQPCVGVFYSRCKEDEEYMAKASIKYIIDCRPKVSARANKVKGKGFEHSAYYSTCKMHFMNIPNIHKIRASFESLKNITLRDDFLVLLHNSKWISYLKAVLTGAKTVSDFLTYQKVSILVHCSDGWDRTSQVSSLAQILIDPFYRTFHGFQVLICKDWLSFGHKFKDRSSSSSDGSPIFIQFLDGVYQIMRQNESEFQFSFKYLLFLADAVYSGKYGTFMSNCEKDLREFYNNTVSVWKEDSAEFFNDKYAPVCEEVLRLNTSISSLVFWEYFYRWDVS